MGQSIYFGIRISFFIETYGLAVHSNLVLSFYPKIYKITLKKYCFYTCLNSTDFEIHITDMVGISSAKEDYDVIKALKNISSYNPVLIITGKEENSKPPLLLPTTKIKFQTIGYHHYNNDSSEFLKAIMENLNN